MEIGEHISKELESIFFDNLGDASRKGVILTWAVPGQGGFGHVNERSNEYVIKQMLDRNFVYDEEMSLYFRSTVTAHTWLRDTIMVFWKQKYYREGKIASDANDFRKWKESSIHLTVGVEVMNDKYLSTTWESFFGAGEFFRHDHVVESYYKALGAMIDEDKRFRSGVPAALMSGEGNQLPWKNKARKMMHDLVDKMFDGTDMLRNIQNLYQRTQLHRNTRIYEMVGEATALGLEQEESDGDIATILNHPSTPSEGTSTKVMASTL